MVEIYPLFSRLLFSLFVSASFVSCINIFFARYDNMTLQLTSRTHTFNGCVRCMCSFNSRVYLMVIVNPASRKGHRRAKNTIPHSTRSFIDDTQSLSCGKKIMRNYATEPGSWQRLKQNGHRTPGSRLGHAKLHNCSGQLDQALEKLVS